MSKLFSLTDKANDLVRRALSLKPEKVTTITANTEVAMDLANEAVSDFTYGEVDRRGQQPGEDIVTVPQGNKDVKIFYNAASREARPIPINPIS